MKLRKKSFLIFPEQVEGVMRGGSYLLCFYASRNLNELQCVVLLLTSKPAKPTNKVSVQHFSRCNDVCSQMKAGRC